MPTKDLARAAYKAMNNSDYALKHGDLIIKLVKQSIENKQLKGKGKRKVPRTTLVNNRPD